MSQATGQLTPHFHVREFRCHDGTAVPADAMSGLREWCRVWGEPLRERFGPVAVTSGYRTASYNRSVGGATRSYHVYPLHRGERVAGASVQPVAVDVVPARGTVRDWQEWASASMARNVHGIRPGMGAGVGYPALGFIHLDTGPRRSLAG